MSLSPLVAEWVAAYERETGRKPSDIVIRMAEHVTKVGKMLREQGLKDAQEGKQPRHQEAHEALVRYAFQLEPDEDPSFVEGIAELWQSSYMNGYQEGGAA